MKTQTKKNKRARIVVFRSNKYLYIQVIDDDVGTTIVSVQSKELEKDIKGLAKGSNLGQLLAKKALTKGVTNVVFDRNGYKYHGIVKAVAEGLRQGGLQF